MQMVYFIEFTVVLKTKEERKKKRNRKRKNICVGMMNVDEKEK